jgi:hypothetical protein
MVPPVWHDERGRRRPVRRRWTCGADVPVMCYHVDTLKQLGWKPGSEQVIVNWCGCSCSYIPWAMTESDWFAMTRERSQL